MRAIFYTVIVALGISLSAVILMPSLFDVKSYKTQIENIVFSKTGNILSIKGDIDISILSGLKIKVSDIEYKMANNDNLFKGKELLISPEIFPLLKGKLVFKSLKLIEPTFFVKEYESGSYNWQIAFSDMQNKKNNKNKKQDIEIEGQKSEPISSNTIKKEKEQSFNFLNIKRLTVKDATIIAELKKNKKKYNKINLTFNYMIDDFYNIDGYFYIKEEKIMFSYDLKYKRKILSLIGYLKGDKLELKNNTQYNLLNSKGKSDLSLKIDDINSFLYSNKIKKASLQLKGKIDIAQNLILLKEISLNSNDNTIFISGEINNKNKVKVLDLQLESSEININDFLNLNQNKKKNKQENIPVKDNTNDKINKSSKNDILSLIFAKLNNVNINSNIVIDKLIYKKPYIFEKINLQLNKINDIDIDANFRFIDKSLFTLKSVIRKNKNTAFKASVKKIDVEKFSETYNYKPLSGKLDILINANSKLDGKEKFLKALNGDLEIKSKSIVLKNINLHDLKYKILNIETLKDLTDLHKEAFKGETSINDQILNAKIIKGNLVINEKKIKIDNEEILLSGKYEIVSKILNANFSYDDQDNKLLSFFNVNLNGNIKNLKASLDYDKKLTEKFVSSMIEKKIKKMIKKNMDNKFNDILENLLD